MALLGGHVRVGECEGGCEGEDWDEDHCIESEGGVDAEDHWGEGGGEGGEGAGKILRRLSN